MSGIVNDVTAVGAEIFGMSVGMIVEEGMDMEDFEKITTSIGDPAKEADVPIITGDTKVVEKGSTEKIFLNTYL